MPPIQLALFAIFPALVIVAALKDVTSFTIPNWISLTLAAAFVPAALVAGLTPLAFATHLGIGVGALAAGIVMFALRWIGGGDAKLFAAAALWLGLPALAPFLIYTALAGGLLALTLVTMRSNFVRAVIPAGPGWVERLREPKGDAPYGLAIAVGSLLAFPASSFLASALG